MKKFAVLFLITANMFGQSIVSTKEYTASAVMKDGDAVLVNVATSNVEDKLIPSHFNLLDIFSSTETMLLVFPLVLLLLFILANLSTIGKLMKSFPKKFLGLFIKFEDENDYVVHDFGVRNSHKNLVYSHTGNCNSCGGNKWHGNMCEYCGSSTYNKK